MQAFKSEKTFCEGHNIWQSLQLVLAVLKQVGIFKKPELYLNNQLAYQSPKIDAKPEFLIVNLKPPKCLRCGIKSFQIKSGEVLSLEKKILSPQLTTFLLKLVTK